MERLKPGTSDSFHRPRRTRRPRRKPRIGRCPRQGFSSSSWKANEAPGANCEPRGGRGEERTPSVPDPAHRPGAAWKAIKVSAPHSHSMQLLQAPPGSFLQFARFPELDRVGGACLGAGGGSPGHGFDPPPRAVEITTQSRFLIPFSSASSGGISANPAGCSSAVEGTIRVGMAPPE